MARLTGYDADGEMIVCEEERLLCSKGIITKDEMYKIMRHLAEKIAEYEDLEEQGRLLKLPCEVGDTLYCDGKYFASHCEGEIHSFKVTDIVTEIRSYFRGEVDYCFDFEDIGKTVFLTKSAAEQALKEREGKK